MRAAPASARPQAPAARRGGFTLLELLIVVVAVAIVAAIAWPSYADSVYKARRADGRVALLEGAQRLERCLTRHDSYSHAACTVPVLSPDGHYRITEPEPRGPASFRLRATPTGAQAGDAASCAWLELDHRGQRTAAGKTGAACW
jgi:type IV pilus assembly protein PilE